MSCSCSTPCQKTCRKTYCQGSGQCTDGCKCVSNVKICHFSVATFEEARGYRNSYVFVESENATYHVDQDGNPLEVNRQPIYEANHVPVLDKHRNQTVYDFTANIAYQYSLTGEYRSWALTA